MKKFSFISSVFLLVLVLVFLFVGCQKEQAATTTDTEQSNSENIKATAGSSMINGLISQDHAQQMSDAFAKKCPRVVTRYVGYSTKNLIAFLNVLLTKYKSDSVFVGYGLYDSNTAPKASYIGRSTIFFMGQNMITTTGAIKVQSVNDEDSNTSNFLNQGALFP